MKFAVHAFNYKNDDLVLRWLANVHPHVDTIYLVYPEMPWDYNQAVASNEMYRNDASPILVQGSPFADKVKLITGQWRSDEDQRNHVVDLAKSEGHDYLIVQDIDEFYCHDELEKNIAGIRANPDFLLYKNPWHIFWKNVSYVLEFRETKMDHNPRCQFHERNTTINFSTSFALNLQRGARFAYSRALRCADDDILLLDGVCCHLSWVKSDADVKTKVDTWTHSTEVWRGWYELKWLNWVPDSKWLAYANPVAWNRAVPFSGRLPEEVADYQPGPQAPVNRTASTNLRELAYDTKAIALWRARQGRAWLRRHGF